MSDPRDSFAPRAENDPHEAIMAELVDGGRPRRKGVFAGLVVILFIVGIVLGPLVYTQGSHEIARWHLAAAIEQRLDGDLDGAIRSLTQSLEKCPNNEELYRNRAQWRIEKKDYLAALADADRAVSLTGGDPWSLVLRSEVYQHLRRYTEAVNDWNTLVQNLASLGVETRSFVLNGRAYARALGGNELSEALADIETALQTVGHNAAMLDTRGFVYYRLQRHRSARTDLEKAVRLIEIEHASLSEELEKSRRTFPDPRQFELQLRAHAATVAVIRYHRALVYRRLNMPKEAEEDLNRVRELGLEPNEDLF
jgi:tetratricopeptide (TPR) repeat protein